MVEDNAKIEAFLSFELGSQPIGYPVNDLRGLSDWLWLAGRWPAAHQEGGLRGPPLVPEVEIAANRAHRELIQLAAPLPGPAVDRDYKALRADMNSLFGHLGIQATAAWTAFSRSQTLKLLSA